MMDVLRLSPSFHSMLWGGTRLHRYFPEAASIDPLGEAWIVSAHPAGSSRIMEGPFAGQWLKEVYQTHRSLFGPGQNTHFPLLIKLIDAKTDLSIQVHPDDAYAFEHEASPGKQEAWVLLETHPESRLVLGHTALDRQSFLTRIQHNDTSLFRSRSVKPGDCFDIEPGTVHAIGAGILLYEVQQNSNITYRIYDYDRVDAHGHKRQLHLDKSLDMIRFPDTKDLKPIRPDKNGVLLQNAFFTLSQREVNGKVELPPNPIFCAMTCINGKGSIGSATIQEGETLLVLPHQKNAWLEGSMRLLVAQPSVRSLR